MFQLCFYFLNIQSYTFPPPHFSFHNPQSFSFFFQSIKINLKWSVFTTCQLDLSVKLQSWMLIEPAESQRWQALQHSSDLITRSWDREYCLNVSYNAHFRVKFQSLIYYEKVTSHSQIWPQGAKKQLSKVNVGGVWWLVGVESKDYNCSSTCWSELVNLFSRLQINCQQGWLDWLRQGRPQLSSKRTK